MPEQERKQKRAESAPSTEGGRESKAVTTKGEKLKEEMDRLVDEIDSVLEENAEEFVKSYVQRGGE
jgi:prokaryotic ubiquitin-like protein Pup